jgi:hypothetical protein
MDLQGELDNLLERLEGMNQELKDAREKGQEYTDRDWGATGGEGTSGGDAATAAPGEVTTIIEKHYIESKDSGLGGFGTIMLMMMMMQMMGGLGGPSNQQPQQQPQLPEPQWWYQ